jgi:hypothetical protein
MRIALQVGGVVFAGAVSAYALALANAWVFMVLFGILYPLAGLGDWALTRRRKSPEVADRTLGYLLAGQIAIFALASRPYWSEAQTDRPVPETVRGEPR